MYLPAVCQWIFDNWSHIKTLKIVEFHLGSIKNYQVIIFLPLCQVENISWDLSRNIAIMPLSSSLVIWCSLSSTRNGWKLSLIDDGKINLSSTTLSAIATFSWKILFFPLRSAHFRPSFCFCFLIYARLPYFSLHDDVSSFYVFPDVILVILISFSLRYRFFCSGHWAVIVEPSWLKAINVAFFALSCSHISPWDEFSRLLCLLLEQQKPKNIKEEKPGTNNTCHSWKRALQISLETKQTSI